MAATTTDAENLACVFTVVFAEDTKTVLAVLPSKNLPRPRKDGNGMTKGLAKPWMLPGGKREKGESALVVVARALQEKTGLDSLSPGKLRSYNPSMRGVTSISIPGTWPDTGHKAALCPVSQC